MCTPSVLYINEFLTRNKLIFFLIQILISRFSYNYSKLIFYIFSSIFMVFGFLRFSLSICNTSRILILKAYGMILAHFQDNIRTDLINDNGNPQSLEVIKKITNLRSSNFRHFVYEQNHCQVLSQKQKLCRVGRLFKKFN